MVMRIEAALDQINSYPEMDQFLANSEVGLSSIIGSRILTAPGYEGEVHLDIVVRQWFHLNRRPGPFSPEEREAAASGQNRLFAHYRTTDRLLNESNNILVVVWRALRWLVLCICDCVEGRDRGALGYYFTESGARRNLGDVGTKVVMRVFGDA